MAKRTPPDKKKRAPKKLPTGLLCGAWHRLAYAGQRCPICYAARFEEQAFLDEQLGAHCLRMQPLTEEIEELKAIYIVACTIPAGGDGDFKVTEKGVAALKKQLETREQRRFEMRRQFYTRYFEQGAHKTANWASELDYECHRCKKSDTGEALALTKTADGIVLLCAPCTKTLNKTAGSPT